MKRYNVTAKHPTFKPMHDHAITLERLRTRLIHLTDMGYVDVVISTEGESSWCEFCRPELSEEIHQKDNSNKNCIWRCMWNSK